MYDYWFPVLSGSTGEEQSSHFCSLISLCSHSSLQSEGVVAHSLDSVHFSWKRWFNGLFRASPLRGFDSLPPSNKKSTSMLAKCPNFVSFLCSWQTLPCFLCHAHVRCGFTVINNKFLFLLSQDDDVQLEILQFPNSLPSALLLLFK